MRKTKRCLCRHVGDAMVHFDDRAMTVDYRSLVREVVGLSGWECKECGETEFDGDSAVRYAVASDQLIVDDRRCSC